MVARAGWHKICKRCGESYDRGTKKFSKICPDCKKVCGAPSHKVNREQLDVEGYIDGKDES